MRRREFMRMAGTAGAAALAGGGVWYGFGGGEAADGGEDAGGRGTAILRGRIGTPMGRRGR